MKIPFLNKERNFFRLKKKRGGAQKKVLCANAQGTFLTGIGLFLAEKFVQVDERGCTTAKNLREILGKNFLDEFRMLFQDFS